MDQVKLGIVMAERPEYYSAAWSVSDTLTEPINPAIAQLAYCADTAVVPGIRSQLRISTIKRYRAGAMVFVRVQGIKFMKALIMPLIIYSAVTLALTGCCINIQDGRNYVKDNVRLWGKYYYGPLPCSGTIWYDHIWICGEGNGTLPDIEIRYDGDHYVRLREIDMEFVARHGTRVGREELDRFSIYKKPECYCREKTLKADETYSCFLMDQFGFLFSPTGELVVAVTKCDSRFKIKHNDIEYKMPIRSEEAEAIFGKPERVETDWRSGL